MAETAYVLARRWKVSRDGAGLAAICYAFSGNVLYQYCNVVFLVGAAWPRRSNHGGISSLA